MKLSPWFLTAILLFSASSGTITAQDWVRQSPYPADNDLRDTFFVSPNVGWVVGEDEIALQTTDGGSTWQQASSFARNAFQNDERLNAVVFVDSQNGFIGANQFYRTTNGGATWQDMGYHGQVRRMEFISPEIGFITSNSGLRRTSDGGQTFQTISSNPSHGLDIDFANESTGLYVSPGVWETEDAGSTWTQISTEVFRLVEYVTEDIVIAVGGPTTRATLNRSTDGGQTWQEVLAVDSMPQNGFTDLARIDNDSIAAVDQNYRIWISDDAGLTWVVSQAPVGNWTGSLPSIHFPTPGVGYVSGGIGLIFKTVDGGHTWTKQNRGGAISLRDIAMHPSGLGIAVGAEQTIFRTTDFGRQWDVFTIDELSLDTLFQVQIISPDVIMTCGYNRVYRSEDGGLTWVRQENGVPPLYDWNGLSFLDENRGWLFGRSGNGGAIYKTTDGGQNWTEILSTPVLGEGEMVSADVGWVVNFQSHMFTTQNAWAAFSRPTLPSNDIYYELDLVDQNVGWIIGTFERVVKSIDGGVTFQVQAHPGYDEDEPEKDQIEDIFALDADNVYLAMRHDYGIQYGTIHHSTDGGDTWTGLNSFGDPTNQFSGRVSEITVLPSGEIWAAGITDGFIWSTDDPSAIKPSAIKLFDGTQVAGNLAALYTSDNQRLDLDPSPTVNPVKQVVSLILQHNSPTATPNTLGFRIEAAMLGGPAGDVEQEILMFNYVTNRFESIDVRDALEFETSIDVFATGDLTRFINPISNEITAMVQFNSESFSDGSFFWSVEIDQTIWMIE